MNEFGGAVQIELFQDAPAIGADSPFADGENIGDIAWLFSLGNEQEDFEFPRREAFVRSFAVGLSDVISKLFGNALRDVAAAGCNALNGAGEFVGYGVLGEIARGTGLDGAYAMRILGMHAEHKHTHPVETMISRLPRAV